MEVRAAAPADVDALVALSAAKRAAYARLQPTFWRPARGADDAQRAWFRALVTRPDTLVLVATEHGTVRGFVIGKVHPAPPVYDPGGLTVTVDDFCVEADAWPAVGGRLLGELRERAAARGAVQVVVVCGAHDREKTALMLAAGLSPASTWYVGAAPG